MNVLRCPDVFMTFKCVCYPGCLLLLLSHDKTENKNTSRFLTGIHWFPHRNFLTAGQGREKGVVICVGLENGTPTQLLCHRQPLNWSVTQFLDHKWKNSFKGKQGMKQMTHWFIIKIAGLCAFYGLKGGKIHYLTLPFLLFYFLLCLLSSDSVNSLIMHMRV